MSYQEKYLKYKKKYLALKNQLGGNWICPVCKEDNEDSRPTCIKMACSGQRPVAVAPDTAERAERVFGHTGFGSGINIFPYLKNKEAASMRLVNKKMKDTVDRHWTNLPSEIAGEFVLSIGSVGTGLGQFKSPYGLSLTPDETQLLVCDAGNSRVVVADAHDGRSLHELRGPVGTLDLPCQAVVVPHTKQVLVLDMMRCVIVVFTSVNDETVLRTLGDGEGQGPRQLIGPCGLAVLDGNTAAPVAVVADKFNHRLVLFQVNDGTLVGHVGSRGTAYGQFKHPSAVSVLTRDNEDLLVVADSGNHRVQVLSRTGAVLQVLLGNQDIIFDKTFNGITVHIESGEVLVTEKDRVVSLRLSDGKLRVVCGGERGSGNGEFAQPHGVVTSINNTQLWVADTHNNRLCLFR